MSLVKSKRKKKKKHSVNYCLRSPENKISPTYVGRFIIQRQITSILPDWKVPGRLSLKVLDFSVTTYAFSPTVLYALFLFLLMSYVSMTYLDMWDLSTIQTHTIIASNHTSLAQPKYQTFLILFYPSNFYTAENLRSFKIYHGYFLTSYVYL